MIMFSMSCLYNGPYQPCKQIFLCLFASTFLQSAAQNNFFGIYLHPFSFKVKHKILFLCLFASTCLQNTPENCLHLLSYKMQHKLFFMFVCIYFLTKCNTRKLYGLDIGPIWAALLSYPVGSQVGLTCVHTGPLLGPSWAGTF